MIISISRRGWGKCHCQDVKFPVSVAVLCDHCPWSMQMWGVTFRCCSAEGKDFFPYSRKPQQLHHTNRTELFIAMVVPWTLLSNGWFLRSRRYWNSMFCVEKMLYCLIFWWRNGFHGNRMPRLRVTPPRRRRRINSRRLLLRVELYSLSTVLCGSDLCKYWMNKDSSRLSLRMLGNSWRWWNTW